MFTNALFHKTTTKNRKSANFAVFFISYEIHTSTTSWLNEHLKSPEYLQELDAFGDWSFGDWSHSEIGRILGNSGIGRSENGRSKIGRSEIGRSENGRSEIGRCTYFYYEFAFLNSNLKKKK
jgi:hypothetical protein